MTTEYTVKECGKMLSDAACAPDKALVQSLGMTPTIAWNSMKDVFEEAFDRKPTEEDEEEFTKGFKLGLLETQKAEVEQAIQEIDNGNT